MGREAGLLPDGLAARFEIVRLLGVGSFGRVFEVRERGGGATRALKLVPLEGDGERLGRELALATRVDHPRVIRTFETGVEAGQGYLVMELARGSLAEEIGRAARIPEVWEWLRQAAYGVAALHAAGVVHRDLKPANILLTDSGAKVADLGIARARDLATLTATGVILGTPAYMAPEQARGERAGPAADVFALGVMWCEALEGSLPYPDLPPLQLLVRVAKGERIRLRQARARLPAAVLGLVESLLDPDPGQRPREVAAWAAALGPFPSGPVASPAAATLELPARISAPAAGATARVGPAPVHSLAPRGSGNLGAPPSAGGRLRGAAVLASIGVLGWLGGAGGWRPAALPTTPAAVPELAARGLAELEAVRRGGALDWDPLAWGEVAPSLPAVRELATWMRRGGRPESLPQDQLEGLGAAGAEYLRLHLLDPFGPLLLAPDPKPEEVLGYPDENRRDNDPPPPPAQAAGWYATFRRLYTRLRDQQKRLEARAKAEAEGSVLAGLPGSGDAPGVLRPGNWDQDFGARPDRLRLCELQEDGPSALRALAHATMRVIREQPELGDLAACYFHRLADRCPVFWFSTLAYLDLGEVLAVPERQDPPAAALLRGFWSYRMAWVRKRAGGAAARKEAAVLELDRNATADLRTALGPVEPGHLFARWRRGAAAETLAKHLKEGGDHAAVIELFRTEVASLGSMARRPAASFVAVVMRVLGAGRVSLAPPEVAQLLAAFRADSAALDAQEVRSLEPILQQLESR